MVAEVLLFFDQGMLGKNLQAGCSSAAALPHLQSLLDRCQRGRRTETEAARGQHLAAYFYTYPLKTKIEVKLKFV